jgi:hypothetical protein
METLMWPTSWWSITQRGVEGQWTEFQSAQFKQNKRKPIDHRCVISKKSFEMQKHEDLRKFKISFFLAKSRVANGNGP